MQEARRIEPPEWMTDYRCVKVMGVLGGYDTHPEALFVGGCVRNFLLGQPVADVDIATLHPPLEVIDRLKAAGVRYVPTGLDHGTVTAIVDDGSYEITTLRKDIEADGRHAVIAFSKDWAEDAERRDFTMNTLLASPDGAIYDPTGQGLDDLEARRIRFVGDAMARVQEDYLRIFRFFRFYALYGAGPPDEEAIAACAANADKVSMLSRERITQECLKILSIPDPSPFVKLMVAHKITPCLETTFRADILANLCALQCRHDVTDVMARLFTIGGMGVSVFEGELVISNEQKRHLDALAKGMARLTRLSKPKIRELVYREGNPIAVQVYLLKLTQKGSLPDLELLDIARYWQAPIFPIKAEQLIEAGVSRGPALGQKLRELEEKWVKSDFSNITNI